MPISSKIKLLIFSTCFVCLPFIVNGQNYFNAWLTSDAHLIGPTGDSGSLKLAVEQAKGEIAGVPSFQWDIQIDAGDWTASQKPPTKKTGVALARVINRSLGKKRGIFFTINGNHDGAGRGEKPGRWFKKYFNPLVEKKFLKTSGFDLSQRPSKKNFRQLHIYPGTCWDRYLVQTGNIIWIMLSDRNEYDKLAEHRRDTSGRFQAGRGSASGMPDGGYPSGAVTLETFEWWKKVIEDSMFSNCILITVTHMLPAYTTIGTGRINTGKDRRYHGETGSVGPSGEEIGGQLYWIREYNKDGKEIMQYAQTRPFLDYLRDHPGAITAWIGGHTHINAPESEINGRGMYVRKYDVTFLNVGSLTDSHGGGLNQMSRVLTFKDGEDEAIVNIYIHKSSDGHPIGFYEPAARRFPLEVEFGCPDSSSSQGNLFNHILDVPIVPKAPITPIKPRYYWNLNKDHYYDFNNEKMVVGADGSPYEVYQRIDNPVYTEDTPMKSGRSLDLRKTNGRVLLGKPYQPQMNWSYMTLSVWIKTNSTKPQDIVSYSPANKVGKFRLWFDGSAWVWDVAEGTVWKSAEMESEEPNDGRWHNFIATVDGSRDLIQLFIDGELVAEEKWYGERMCSADDNSSLVIGASGDKAKNNLITWSHSFNGLVDELAIYDTLIDPKVLSMGCNQDYK